ncbi:hypothetical protein CPAR01_10372 [Colletotrichum paranaense]|uniref:Uncharacterized protein n=1 Tax=Colletotrichum paranaense TaxID=1914294 RepID=A0ABQ9SDV5_9PEZI|nr:uncharacterized protein CPAR01_10372 [Colletotrichum paranaense]KAK1533664.1 hypothetical protein CPAR01_10372 [Colletotrichum paranaense]
MPEFDPAANQQHWFHRIEFRHVGHPSLADSPYSSKTRLPNLSGNRKNHLPSCLHFGPPIPIARNITFNIQYPYIPFIALPVAGDVVAAVDAPRPVRNHGPSHWLFNFATLTSSSSFPSSITTIHPLNTSVSSSCYYSSFLSQNPLIIVQCLPKPALHTALPLAIAGMSLESTDTPQLDSQENSKFGFDLNLISVCILVCSLGFTMRSLSRLSYSTLPSCWPLPTHSDSAVFLPSKPCIGPLSSAAVDSPSAAALMLIHPPLRLCCFDIQDANYDNHAKKGFISPSKQHTFASCTPPRVGVMRRLSVLSVV